MSRVTDRDALLAGINANPDDDAPYLVYADWLDEHGDPRQAARIRRQIADQRAKMFNLPDGSTSPLPPPLPRHRSPTSLIYPAPR